MSSCFGSGVGNSVSPKPVFYSEFTSHNEICSLLLFLDFIYKMCPKFICLIKPCIEPLLGYVFTATNVYFVRCVNLFKHQINLLHKFKSFRS